MQRRANGQNYLESCCSGQESSHENVGLMSFIIRACKSLTENGSVLDLASGPTIYQIFPAARRAFVIVISDSSPTLLSFAEEWRDRDDGAFDWDPYIKKVLQLETSQDIESEDSVDRRKDKTRKALEFAVLDISRPQSMNITKLFDLVQCAFLSSSCEAPQDSLLEIWKKSASYVKQGGHLVIIEVCDAVDDGDSGSNAAADGHTFEKQEKLIANLGCEVIDKEFLQTEGQHGYAGFAMFHLRKPETHSSEQ